MREERDKGKKRKKSMGRLKFGVGNDFKHHTYRMHVSVLTVSDLKYLSPW